MNIDYCDKKNWHPAANAFPLLAKSDPERFAELVSNVRENGLLEPVVLFESKVLDGRNRLLACKEAGIAPRFEHFVPNGVGPVSWIAAKHTRRDLDASQRAAAALTLLPLLETEAKERERMGKQTIADPETKGQARNKAASLTGANRQYVSDAKRIVAKDASMLERIRDGEITIQEAKRQLGFQQSVSAMASSESNEWYTPKNYVNAATVVLGKIDLDPASCEAANKIIKAEKFFDKVKDGLKQVWSGKVWLNPPYGDLGPKFVKKLLQEYESGRCKEAILIVNSHCTDAKWFQPLFDYTLCFTDHRTQFWNLTKQNDRSTHGSVIVYFGKNQSTFVKHFASFGSVVTRWSEK